MNTRLAALDENRSIDAADRRRVLSFVLLGDYLTSESASTPIAQGYQQVWAAAAGRSASDFVGNGTPFFWKNVNRCLALSAPSLFLRAGV